MPQFRRSLVALVAVLSAACSGEPAAPDVPPVVAVTATGGATSITSGSSVQLAATLADRRGRPVSNPVFTWSSANGAIAAVSATGLVTGIQAGTTNITATSDGTSGSISLTVTPGAPAKLVVATQPGGAASGVRLVAQPVIEVRDNADNVVTSATTTVSRPPVGWGRIRSATISWSRAMKPSSSDGWTGSARCTNQSLSKATW